MKEWDLRGSQREGDVCIRGQAKPKSSAVGLHTTSGLKMPDWSQHTVNADACTEQDLLYTASLCIFLFKFSICHLTSSSRAKLRLPCSYRIKKRRCHFWHRDTTNKIQQRFTWGRSHNKELEHVCVFHVYVLPVTSASGCQNLSPQEPNTASLHRSVLPVSQRGHWIVSIEAQAVIAWH